MATAGSFWWFWGVVPVGLPTDTSASVAGSAAAAGIALAIRHIEAMARIVSSRFIARLR
jgi:hypothetical protein